MEKNKNITLFYGSLLLLECLLWGIGNPVMKIGFDSVSPLFMLSIRYIMAFLIFMLVLGRRVVTHVKKKHIMPYIIISAFTAGAFIFGAFSLTHTTATNSGFLMATPVIFTPFLSKLVLKTKIDKKHLLPIIIVTIGLYLLCSGGSGSFYFGLGELFGILCAISGSGMLVFSSKYLQDMDPLTTSVMQTGFTGVFCIIFALIFEDVAVLTNIPPIGWWVIVYLAVGCTCIAYVLQNISLQKISPTYAALAFCSEPIFTAIASYFLLGEMLSLIGFAGAALIMISIIMASLTPEELPDTEKLSEPKKLADTEIDDESGRL